MIVIIQILHLHLPLQILLVFAQNYVEMEVLMLERIVMIQITYHQMDVQIVLLMLVGYVQEHQVYVVKHVEMESEIKEKNVMMEMLLIMMDVVIVKLIQIMFVLVVVIQHQTNVRLFLIFVGMEYRNQLKNVMMVIL